MSGDWREQAGWPYHKPKIFLEPGTRAVSRAMPSTVGVVTKRSGTIHHVLLDEPLKHTDTVLVQASEIQAEYDSLVEEAERTVQYAVDDLRSAKSWFTEAERAVEMRRTKLREARKHLVLRKL